MWCILLTAALLCNVLQGLHCLCLNVLCRSVLICGGHHCIWQPVRVQSFSLILPFVQWRLARFVFRLSPVGPTPFVRACQSCTRRKVSGGMLSFIITAIMYMFLVIHLHL